MNCPNCGKEILDEDATFCPKCGKPLEAQLKRPDYVLVAAILTLIAGAFSASIGYIAIYRFATYFPLYDFFIIFGFLIFGIVDIVASVFAIAGATFMMKRRFVVLSMLGVVLLLVSAVITYVTIAVYQYGFSDIMILSEISIIIFSIVSGIFVAASRKVFT